MKRKETQLKLMSIKQVADFLGLSYIGVHKMITDKTIPSEAVVRLSRRVIRIKQDVLNNWINSCTLKNADVEK